jgi:hypothetical protein
MLDAVYLLFIVLTLPFPVPPQSISVGVFIMAMAMNVFLAKYPETVLDIERENRGSSLRVKSPPAKPGAYCC